MPPSSVDRARRAAAVTQIPNRVQTNVTLYDGSALNVDYASYLAQHDLVYLAPPLEGTQGMPIGDGDTGAMVWCPDRLQFQVQKSDLWADPPDGTDASEWRQLSAGAVSLSSNPSFLQDPTQFEQRLSLHSGVLTIRSDNAHGSCQITAFVSAVAGVLVIHYRDQSVRNAERRLDISLQRDAHLFALGETAGVLQAFRDRRYALLTRIVGCPTRAVNQGSGKCGLRMEASRSSDFTVYVAVATSPRNGDPVAMARSRIQAAIAKGFERLLAEQKQHWGQFWEKSFLRLNGPDGDALPGYLENLWYLGLYQQACCSRGFDAPLANGGLWLSGETSRIGDALYTGRDLRAMLASLIPSNHLELSVPYVDTQYRMLPDLAAQTGNKFGLAGACFPARFNRFGADLSAAEPATTPALKAAEQQEVREGLESSLLVFEAWRHAPDPFFLRERAYPLLRASAVFAIERCHASTALWADAALRKSIAAALRALLWADKDFDLGEELRPDWERLLNQLPSASPYPIADLLPFGALKSRDSKRVFQSLISAVPQQVNGFFGENPGAPDLAYTARLCSGLSGMLLSERPIVSGAEPGKPGTVTGFAGVPPSAIQVFAGLPASWGGAFSLIAPGGFRISAEAVQGQACYVAVKSLLGGVCRIANPWGPEERVRILQGRVPIIAVTAAVLEFPTEPNTAYLIEPYDRTLARAATVRLIGKPNAGPKECGSAQLGIPAVAPPILKERNLEKLPADAVVSVTSRIERARMNLKD